MAEAFEPITTQEAFEAAVADRLAPYADYNDLKAQNEALAGQVAELNTRSHPCAATPTPAAAAKRPPGAVSQTS